MAKKLKLGDRIRGYRITKVFGPGAMAISYAAESADGTKIFLKQYKSPAPTVIWYPAFVDYQQELAARVRNGKAAHYAVRLVDAFEEMWGGRTYFQAYEFVSNGSDLQHMLDEERAVHERTRESPLRDPEIWARHVTWSKVLMAGIAALHESKVVHADLKPPNAYLVRDPSIGSGYQLKLIDMDFSVLSDKRAPWHGHQGYVGSDNYRSPEHLTRGSKPELASDIFTCGLILYELLAGVHPYWREDQAEYAAAVRAYSAKPPVLAGVMPAPASNDAVSKAIHRCLSPNAADRPTAAELRALLSGRGPRAEARPAAAPATGVSPAARKPAPGKPPSGKPPAGKPPASRPPAGKPPAIRTTGGAPLTSDRIQLIGTGGRALQIGVRTEVGKHLATQFGADAEFLDARQFVLERSTDRQWRVSPLAGTPNETLVNGEAVVAPRILKDGDVIAVGRQAKKIAKLPLTVRGA